MSNSRPENHAQIQELASQPLTVAPLIHPEFCRGRGLPPRSDNSIPKPFPVN